MAFEKGAQRIATEHNFLSHMDILHPEIDATLTERYGSEVFHGLLDMVGASKVSDNQTYSHFETNRRMPKILATATVAGGAGQEATFTLDASATSSVALNASPYPASSTSTNTGVPVRVGDTIMIPNQAGTVNYANLIFAYVNSVDSTAGTFTALPLDSTITLPAIATASEIVIYGNAMGEMSKDRESMATDVTKYENNVQRIRENYKISGTASAEKMWFNVGGSWYYTYKGEKDAWARYSNYKDLTMLVGRKMNNALISDGNITAQGNGSGAVATTDGLINQVITGGNQINYASGTGLQITDLQNLAKALDKNKGAKNNMMLAGISLSLAFDDTIRTDFANGSLVFGNYKFSEAQKVNLEFDTMKVGSYVFSKKTFDPFNEAQTLGSEGFNFDLEALVIPMDSKTDPVSGERIQSVRKRYLAQDGVQSRETKKAIIDNFKLQDGEDSIAVRYLSECGLETFALNRFAFISLT